MTTPEQPDLPLSEKPPEPARFPDNESIPEVLRNRTGPESLAIIDALRVLGVEGAIPNGLTPAPPKAPAPPPPPDNTAEQLQQLADRQAETTIALAREKFGGDFKKYGPEIAQALAGVPRHQLTIDTIANAVALTRGRHVDEIVAERVRERETTMHSTMRSTGRSGPVSVPTPQETVSGQAVERWKQRAHAEGITDRQIKEFCDANDMTPDAFWRQFGSGIVSDAIADVPNKRQAG